MSCILGGLMSVEEQAAYHGIAQRIGICDPHRDMAAQVPYQVLAGDKAGRGACVQNVPASVQDVDTLRSPTAVNVPIQKVQRDLVDVGVIEGQIDVERSPCVPAGRNTVRRG